MEYEQGKMEGSQNGLLFLEIENLLAKMNADTRSTQKSLTLLIHSVFYVKSYFCPLFDLGRRRRSPNQYARTIKVSLPSIRPKAIKTQSQSERETVWLRCCLLLSRPMMNKYGPIRYRWHRPEEGSFSADAV